MDIQTSKIQRFSKNLYEYTLYAVSGSPTILANARNSFGEILSTVTLSVTGTTDASTGASLNSLTNLWANTGAGFPAGAYVVDGIIANGTVSVGFCAPEYLRGQTARVTCSQNTIVLGGDISKDLLPETFAFMDTSKVNGSTMKYCCYSSTASSTVYTELMNYDKELLWQGTISVVNTASSLQTLAINAGCSVANWNNAVRGAVRIITGGPIYVNTGADSFGAVTFAPTVNSAMYWVAGNTYGLGVV